MDKAQDKVQEAQVKVKQPLVLEVQRDTREVVLKVKVPEQWETLI